MSRRIVLPQINPSKGKQNSNSPEIIWHPSPELVSTSNIGQIQKELRIATYSDFHRWTVDQYSDYWHHMINRLNIQFAKPYKTIVDLSQGATAPRWLPGAEMNIADSCFAAPEGTTAIVYQNEPGKIESISVDMLRKTANRVANGLRDAGYTPGDALAILMPMRWESVAIYLGIILAGCIVVSVADSFAPPEVEKRLRLGEVRGVFTQDVLLRDGKRLPLYERIGNTGNYPTIVLPQADSVSVGLAAGDRDWQTFLSDKDQFNSAKMNSHDCSNILFSSGTTGEPKTIPWTHTTPIKCAVDAHIHQNIQAGDVLAWPTNLGWMMGPWLIYAGLINRGTIALYGDVPTRRGFGQFVQDARVTMLGVVPSLVRTWKSSNCMDGLDWSRIKTFSSTGESSNVEDMSFLMSMGGNKPIIEYCGGTEIGGAYITGTVVQAASPAAFSTPACGVDFYLLDEEGNKTSNGEVFLSTPSIGFSTELKHQDHQKVYFEGTPRGPKGEALRRHGDQIEELPGGYYRAHGRVDDTMNLNGIKVSSIEIERTLNQVAGVLETAAIVVRKPTEPGQLVIFACLEPDDNADKASLLEQFTKATKTELNPLFKISDIVILDSLPRTASNKIMRRKLRALRD